jgi:hypothetical protein
MKTTEEISHCKQNISSLIRMNQESFTEEFDKVNDENNTPLETKVKKIQTIGNVKSITDIYISERIS